MNGIAVSPYAFTARELDPETGLYHFRERQYDPSGHFISPDPLGIAGGLHFYEYAAGNPFRFVDSDGTRPRRKTGSVPFGFGVPPGVSVDKNIELVQRMRDEGRVAQFIWYAQMVKSGGPWDYKNANQDYRPFGDYNYGATASALGLNGTAVLWAAGAYQFYSGFPGSLLPASLLQYGTPFTGWPYGDTPGYQPYIQQGMWYYGISKAVIRDCP